MKTVSEPKDHVLRLWEREEEREGRIFRLMRYVMRSDYKGEILLHNIVTGHLVVLSRDEAGMFDSLPCFYSPVMEQLADMHFVVPEAFDEHQHTASIREILRTMDKAVPKRKSRFTVIPTTVCNARCPYCFEKGIRSVTMTEKTARDVTDYIARQCGSRAILLNWFGGEPTVAADRIDMICKGLMQKGISFQSSMITNGFLLNEEMALRAVNLWKLKFVQISVDGTEINYNRTKAYVNGGKNPYRQVLYNIGLLLDQKVAVNVRMNFNRENYTDFYDLVEEIKCRYGSAPSLKVYAYPVIEDAKNRASEELQKDRIWFEKMLPKLNQFAEDAGMKRRKTELPFLRFQGCEADSDSAVVITAEGRFLKCVECYGDDQTVGSIYDGITEQRLAGSWKMVLDNKVCAGCIFYPRCMKMQNCPGRDWCIYAADRARELEYAMKTHFDRCCP